MAVFLWFPFKTTKTGYPHQKTSHVFDGIIPHGRKHVGTRTDVAGPGAEDSLCHVRQRLSGVLCKQTYKGLNSSRNSVLGRFEMNFGHDRSKIH